MNTGKNSEELFEELLKRKYGKKVFIHRVTDTSEVRGRSGAGFTKPQPSDYIVTEDGEMYYAEVKSSNGKVSFPFGDITTTQIGTAKRQRLAGGNYYFFIHSLVFDKWFKVPGDVILDHQRKSLKWKEMEKYQWELSFQT